MKMKQYFLVASMLLLGMTAHAQTTTEFKPHVFVQLQGGANYNLEKADFNKTVSFAGQYGVGYQFSPVFGLRLGVNGWKAKGGFSNNETYNWKYLSPTLDLKFSLINAIWDYNPSRFFDMNFILGGGANIAWDNDDNYGKYGNTPYVYTIYPDDDYFWSGTKARFVGRFGLDFDFKVNKYVSFNLEAIANATSEKYNSRPDNIHQLKFDWYFAGLLGLKVNLSNPQREVKPVTEDYDRPLSLYEQMQAGVNDRMNTWMKRLKGESKAEYLARTSDAAIQTQRLEYVKTISTDMAGNRANTSVKDLQYSKDAELLGVQFEDMPSIALKVPASDINSIKGTSDLRFTNTVYNLNPGDKFEVLYTEAVNPATGKKYTYVKQTDAQFVQTDSYMPLTALHQDMVNKQRLQAIATNAVQEAKDKNILSDNTTITVSTEVLPTAGGKTDYRVSYKYTVKDAFSVQDDFAPGKYDADQSAASTAMLKIINKSLSEDFAKYVQAGKDVEIRYTGSADAKPINGKIAYSGKYGNIKDQTVNVNGKPEKLTVTKATGITSNEQLSLVRAISVKNYINKNVPALKNMKVTDSFNVEVSPNEGSQFRRVAVDFLFRDATLK